MLISLGIVPMVPEGMQNRLTCFSFPLCHKRYCCSENSCAPPPVPSTIPICRFSSIDIFAMSRPESATASVVAARQRGTTRDTCLRSRASTQASSSNSGISPAMWTRSGEESNREMRFTPDFPASTARQKASLPVPFGLTTPIPVMTTRGSMNEVEICLMRLSVSSYAGSGIIIQMALGLYISVPFCKTKCTYCNFASDVFSRAVFDRYIARACFEIEHARETAERMGGLIDDAVDSVYLGGGTPTILQVAQLERLFVTISQNFDLTANAEITVECAPGTLSQAMVDTLAGCGANRV